MLASAGVQAFAADTGEDDSPFFTTNSYLFYKIGGANRVWQPLTPDTRVAIGTSGNANFGYSCGKFDISASFKNLMDNFKNGVDDAVNAVVNSANAAISSLPALTLQRALPGLYDMFQEYKLDAETEIKIANKSCEEMEAQIARGENPYAYFFQLSKAETWKEEAAEGGDITKAKEKSEKEAGDGGITEFGEKVGGINQPPMKVVETAVIAGYNYATGNQNNPTQSTIADANTELGQTFASASIAATWATDVLGEYEINNKVPITQIGSGLTPKVEEEKTLAKEQLQNLEYDNLGIGPLVLRNIKILSVKDQNTVYSNLIDDIAIQRVIKKALAVRRLLLSGNQAEASDQRDKKIALLEREIDSLMFERKVKQELANNTMLDVLKIRAPDYKPFKQTDDKPFF